MDDTWEIPAIYLFYAFGDGSKIKLDNNTKYLITSNVIYHTKNLKTKQTVSENEKLMKILFGKYSKFNFKNTKTYPFNVMKRKGNIINYYGGDWD